MKRRKHSRDLSPEARSETLRYLESFPATFFPDPRDKNEIEIFLRGVSEDPDLVIAADALEQAGLLYFAQGLRVAIALAERIAHMALYRADIEGAITDAASALRGRFPKRIQGNLVARHGDIHDPWLDTGMRPDLDALGITRPFLVAQLEASYKGPAARFRARISASPLAVYETKLLSWRRREPRATLPEGRRRANPREENRGTYLILDRVYGTRSRR